jgi:hypothetical protein
MWRNRALKFHQDVLQVPISGHLKEAHLLVVTGWIDTATRIYLDSRTGERLRFKKGLGDGTVPLLSASDGRDQDNLFLRYAPGICRSSWRRPRWRP